jgi:predicted porin
MNKKLISMAVGAALTAGTVVAQAADDAAMPTVYGKAHVSYGAVKDEDTSDTGVKTTNDDNIQLKSHASRIGVKGSVPISDGLKATYKSEWQIDLANENGDSEFKYRNQYVGLKGGFGEVRFGNHDSPVKMAQGKFDEFNDTYGDWATEKLVMGDKRNNNSITYLSPDWGGFSFDVQLAPGEGSGEDGGNGDSFADNWSAAVQFAKAGFFVSYGYDIYDSKRASGDYEALGRLVLTYGNKMFQVGGFSEAAVADTDLTTDGDKSSFGLSGHVTLANVHKIKLQWMQGTRDIDAGDDEETQTSLGYDFKMGKATTAYALYNMYEKKQKSVGDTKNEKSQIVIGLIQKW